MSDDFRGANHIEDITPPTGVNDDTTPTGACDDDMRLSVTGDTVDKARLASMTDETDAGTLSCVSTPGRLASERSAAATLTVYEVTVSLSLGLRPA